MELKKWNSRNGTQVMELKKWDLRNRTQEIELKKQNSRNGTPIDLLWVTQQVAIGVMKHVWSSVEKAMLWRTLGSADGNGEISWKG